MTAGHHMLHLLIILFAAIFTDNILLARFLGMCSFLSVSRQVKTAVGLGLAVVFVMTFTIALDWLAYRFVLQPYGIEYFRFIHCILVFRAGSNQKQSH